jgi:glycosyltransferase involved in cell wall biosynthesis
VKESTPKRAGLRIALVGTRGVPAHYGGFETCVEEVGRRLAERGHHVTVYCRSGNGAGKRVKDFAGMRLVHLPALRRRSLETLSHTGLSVAHLLARRADATIVFNAANAPWLPLLRLAKLPVATHMDGLEWKRAKWGPVGKRYYRWAEGFAVRFSNALIADAAGIRDYYRTTFDAATELISYGAPLLAPKEPTRLASVGLVSGQYHLVVARLEPENHVHTIVEGYVRSSARLPLVVVGSTPYGHEYNQKVQESADARVKFLGGVWDQELLDELYANALVYWHGHSVGGTNPSLLRAIGAGAATNAFDVNFNREVLGSAGRYFRNPDDVAQLAEESEAHPGRVRFRADHARQIATQYDWDVVADGYEALCYGLDSRTLTRAQGHARSTRTSAPSQAPDESRAAS